MLYACARHMLMQCGDSQRPGHASGAPGSAAMGLATYCLCGIGIPMKDQEVRQTVSRIRAFGQARWACDRFSTSGYEQKTFDQESWRDGCFSVKRDRTFMTGLRPKSDWRC